MNAFGHLKERLLAREFFFSFSFHNPFSTISICSENGHRTKGTKAPQYFLD